MYLLLIAAMLHGLTAVYCINTIFSEVKPDVFLCCKDKNYIHYRKTTFYFKSRVTDTISVSYIAVAGQVT